MLIWRRSVLQGGIFEEEQSGLELSWRPDLDVFESADGILLCLSLPGVRPEDVDVSASGRTLIISGERRHTAPHGAVARLIESSSGRFARPVRLPANASVGRIRTEMAEGLLRVYVPKDAC
jgi:HSP20 family protein